MEYGFWLPIFGGWLRNVDDESMPPTFEYAKQTAQAAEQLGFSTTLIAELNLNDIKGVSAPSLEAWTTAAALAAVTDKLEIMTAVRPGFHNPAVTAKMAANIDQLSNGRFTLNVVSAWWEEEARQYGGVFTAHDERYDRTEEFVTILKGLWKEEEFSYKGNFYELHDTHLSPKPVQKQGIKLYAGGESERGKEVIVNHADAYVMHGGTVEEVSVKIEDMKNRRKKVTEEPLQSFGLAAYVICRDTEEEAVEEWRRITDVKDDALGYAGYQDFISKSHLEQQVKLNDYSVSNRGLRPNLIGTPEQIAERILAFEKVGVTLLLLQFSPQLEEMKRFSEKVMPLVEAKRKGLITNE
ncbi:LLM class flavin-dependent oxidoreductase [Bacillus thuringiensis]|uniref:LLM class flavin-dependent oxidoreductase n=1 Tax=Bacillus TaxID=1386 RepID=UPI00065C1AE6|nr:MULTISPECIES: LLM class flavin-dependent oxidoreductase [Bacillus]KMQ06817.1 alkanesulfonate monooxygenase [Bacillus cereus]MBR9745023.1 LLM class flavin-dependent oxidoreductase [Bacillus cereus]MDA1645030.1 LLM class flavin-dependent oxidoreductase [Bacillus cereus group sp. TH163-1LC]MDA1793466.1 LLM class flavin-dependent oxidoreductase [Bacillus cereus group sp. BY8-1LC]MDA1879494.1 LLM class flavin-dependent oxidoreductase [Bacillus cereus group sp. BY10-2LC]